MHRRFRPQPIYRSNVRAALFIVGFLFCCAGCNLIGLSALWRIQRDGGDSALSPLVDDPVAPSELHREPTVDLANSSTEDELGPVVPPQPVGSVESTSAFDSGGGDPASRAGPESALPLVFFMHIPKTGGQSFSGVLHRLVVGRSPTKWRRSSNGTFEQQAPLAGSRRRAGMPLPFRHMRRPRPGASSLMNRRLVGDDPRLPSTKTRPRRPMRFDVSFAQNAVSMSFVREPALFRRRLANHTLLVGHAEQAWVTQQLAPRPVFTVTMMRNPVRRLLSLYVYIVTKLYGYRGKLNADAIAVLVEQLAHANELGDQELTRLLEIMARGKPPLRAGPPRAGATAAASNNNNNNNNNVATVGDDHQPLPRAVFIAKDQMIGADSNCTWWCAVARRSFPTWAAAVVPVSKGVQLGRAEVPAELRESFSRQSNLEIASLTGFVESLAADGQDNYVTRALTGTLFSPDSASLDESVLGSAKQSLEELPFFGITERYADSVRLLEHTARSGALGPRIASQVDSCNFTATNFVRAPKRNSSPAHLYFENLSEAQRATLNRVEQYDVALYQHALALFNERLRLAGIQPTEG